jgi:uncharacterized protein (TIGR01655 family)
MKKIIFGLAALLILLGIGGFAWYKVSYGGTSYYTQIMANGQKTETRADSGEFFYQYNYDQNAVDAKGNVKKLSFNASHDLRKTAYLKLTWNKNKGVTNWQEVEKSEIPAQAAEKLK